LSVSLPERWLEDHPYLRQMAELCGRVDRALSELPVPPVTVPTWEAYREDLEAGIPLLSSTAVRVDLEAAGAGVASLVHRLETEPLAGPVAAEMRALSTELSRTPELAHRIVPFLLGDESVEVPSPGLLRFLGWLALARSLRPVVEAFGQWRDEDRWLRRYCPTCGSLPAMAQIAGMDPARHRLLSCGRCGTRWRYRRTQCPFCENDAHRLSGLRPEGEAGLRIDHCNECGGYLKTYDGQGQEALLLADWTSLHLDLLAHRRGLKRQATSLYDVESLLGA
jgi:FdhE protein